MTKISIRKADINDIPDLIPLFDAYRQFYRQQSDYVGAKSYLTDRISKKESIIFMAYNNSNAVGFTQLFTLFSSVSMEPMFLLNDLYVEKNYRGLQIGTALINQAKELCEKLNYKGIALQTETDNQAQKLYEHLKFKKDPDLHYFWKRIE
ncbi:MAG: GNAT family N-acetyltransferase [bacterium]